MLRDNLLKGFDGSKPIIGIEQNSTIEVVDGHHRTAAMRMMAAEQGKDLEIPVMLLPSNMPVPLLERFGSLCNKVSQTVVRTNFRDVVHRIFKVFIP